MFLVLFFLFCCQQSLVTSRVCSLSSLLSNKLASAICPSFGLVYFLTECLTAHVSCLVGFHCGDVNVSQISSGITLVENNVIIINRNHSETCTNKIQVAINPHSPLIIHFKDQIKRDFLKPDSVNYNPVSAPKQAERSRTPQASQKPLRSLPFP